MLERRRISKLTFVEEDLLPSHSYAKNYWGVVNTVGCINLDLGYWEGSPYICPFFTRIRKLQYIIISRDGLAFVRGAGGCVGSNVSKMFHCGGRG
jgi:hypothetical protein